jgi:hypothetical protein
MALEPILTRILILSDTHGMKFPLPQKPFGFSPPKVDIVLHCGDLTRAKNQSHKAYEGAIDTLAAFPAELKLVIAGNHDIALDAKEWVARGGRSTFHQDMVLLMTGAKARAAGIIYLSEGMYSFTLKSGAKLSVYATPYTPLYSSSAFKYEVKADRFNVPDHIPESVGSISVAETPVPDWPAVDIMMTHGPAFGILDICKTGTNAGCENMRRALERARPRLHCFGHVHEGYGAEIFDWDNRTSRVLVDEADSKSKGGKKNSRGSVYPAALKCDVEFGRETIMINAAIVERHHLVQNNKLPWVIELDLPCGEIPPKDSDMVGLGA